MEGDHFTDADERVYIDLRDSKERTGKLEKSKRNDSQIVLKVNLKAARSKKKLWLFTRQISVFGN